MSEQLILEIAGDDVRTAIFAIKIDVLAIRRNTDVTERSPLNLPVFAIGSIYGIDGVSNAH